MQAVLPDLAALGARLAVLSPQLPALTREGRAKQKLNFPILFDAGNRVGAAFGLAFRLPDDLIGVYRGFGLDLTAHNGDDSWTLSMPARIVIRHDGIVASAEADPDYTRRPEAEETLDVVRRL